MPKKIEDSDKRIPKQVSLTEGKWAEIEEQRQRLNHGDLTETMRLIIEFGLDAVRKLG